MADSTHRVEVVEVQELLPHPNADTLSRVAVHGFTVNVKTDMWTVGDLAAYIPPDSLVPLDRPAFEFLKDPKKPDAEFHRIKVIKQRGLYSQGMLIPAPSSAQIGDNVAGMLGIEHYVPPEPLNAHELAPEPPGAHIPHYDVECGRRFGSSSLVPGELVCVTEKIHGSNVRFTYRDEQMHVGNRKTWLVKDSRNMWWRALDAHPEIETFCRRYPNAILYGELYGNQDLKYGRLKGQHRVALFDIFNEGQFVTADEALLVARVNELPWVPVIHESFPYDTATMALLAEGNSLMPGAEHIREGIVIRPAAEERWHPECGRVALKIVSNAYLEAA